MIVKFYVQQTSSIFLQISNEQQLKIQLLKYLKLLTLLSAAKNFYDKVCAISLR